jgi:hypothetical protein
MKSQQRHEMQTNELADRLGNWLQRVKPYWHQIALGAAVVVVVAIVVVYFNNQRIARNAAGWSDYFQAFAMRDPQALSEVARLHSGNPAALWAEQAAGDLMLATGAGQVFTDREEAEQSLRNAEQHFLAVEQAAARQPLLLVRARYGLAQTYETMADTEKARNYYQIVYQAEPDSALGRVAKERFDELSGDATERWYAWFDRQEPPQPEGGVGGFDPQVPDDLDRLPSYPDLSFPGSESPSVVPLVPPEGTFPDVPVDADPVDAVDPVGPVDAADPVDADPMDTSDAGEGSDTSDGSDTPAPTP